MYGVYKVRTRALWGPETTVNQLVGVFGQKDFADALVNALHREQMETVGTILDTYEVDTTEAARRLIDPEIVKNLLTVIDALMPGIGALALPDYAIIDEAPLKAQEWLKNHV